MLSTIIRNTRVLVPVFVITVSCLLGGSLQAQVCYVTHYLTVSDQDDVVRTVDPITLEVVDEVSLSIPNAVEIDGIRAIAVHPTTGNWFLLGMLSLPVSPAPSPWLLEYDPINITLNPVGFTVLDFNDLDFLESGELRAITNALSTGSSNYCALSTITGGPTDLCQYTGSDGGDSIAIGAAEEVFRASGGYSASSTAQLERPDTPGGSNCQSLSIPLPSALADEPVRTITYNDDSENFIWVQGDTNRSVYSVATDGTEALLGTLDHDVNGLALIEIATPCAPTDQFIRGDCNLDLGVNVADAVFLLTSLFVPGGDPLGCLDAGDVNDDGGTNVADAVFLLTSLFVPGAAPIPAPNIQDGCNPDPTDTDPLDCQNTGC